MIDYIHKDLYWQDSIDKQLKIELEDGTILDNSMIYSEEFELEESLCSDDELQFGSCEASCVKFRIFSIPNRLVGQKITISEVLGGQTDSPMQIGKYKIASAKPTADRDFIDIVAYDSMYDIIHADVAAWYNNQFKATTTTTTDKDGNETTVVTYSTTTLKKFRDSFFSHFGIEQVDVTLPNDNMVVSKTIEIVPNEDGTIGETLSGSMVIEAICELNGCFGHINRDGKFEYVTLQPISKELFPADDLYPINDLYPASDNVGVVIYNWQYEATEYEDFDAQPITQVQIIQEDNDIGMTVGSDGNKYVVNSNFLTYSLSDAELETVGTNILSVVEKAKYTPIKASVIGNPCVTVGDIIKIVTNSAILYSYVINRTLKGCQSLTDEFESNGEEYRSVDVNSTSGQIKKLQGRSNVLERSIDETRMTITNVEKGLKNDIKVTAEGIEETITKNTTELKTYADNAASTAEINTNINTEEKLKSYPTKTEMTTEISASATQITASVTETLKDYSTTEEMNSAIEVTKDSIESTVSKAHSLWELPIGVDGNEIIYGYGTAEENGLDPETSKKPLYLNVETGFLQSVGINPDTHEVKWIEYAQCEKIEDFLQSQIDQNEEGVRIETERATKAEGKLQSSIDVQAQEIVLKVDANGRIVQVALTGDAEDGTEFTVDADNIFLTASDIIDIIANNSINLTSKNITIDSTNFSVDENGNMICNGAKVSGEINATLLNIIKNSLEYGRFDSGTFTISNNFEGISGGTFTSDGVAMVNTSSSHTSRYIHIGFGFLGDDDVVHIPFYVRHDSMAGDWNEGYYMFFGGTIEASNISNISTRLAKKNIEPLSNEEAKKILDVNVVSFDYINGESKNQRGVIYEEVKDIIPSVAVCKDKDYEEHFLNGEEYVFPGVDYSKFTPYLIKMAQIQQQEIDALKQQLATLTERMDRYEQNL
nr:MAG TPA: endosialidase chaperone [Bacteriophage sp.]